MTRFRELIAQEDGQALTEYGLILGLIAVVCVGALTLMGTNVNNMLKSIASTLGNTGSGGNANP
ncbi:MAG: Flp family type IVb pilin [Cyanobacteria bacterium NC_groundwater_1444_Ag_S-0.65um_54_12]|nr:Flp family type IVb pilin [Cyanobacteria bacterium NC_groundwater_1444_Ag_S-0.65um_54_12]